MLKSLQSYMYIGQNQRKGIALTCLCILSYGLFRHFYIQFHLKPLPEINLLKEAENIADPVAGLDNISLNKINSSQLISIGLPEKLASRLINFRDKIGGFKNWDQVKKVYGLTSEQFSELKKHSFINEKTGAKIHRPYSTASKEKKPFINTKTKIDFKPSVFDPNTVTMEDLTSMGIQQKIAKGIINFRNAGFKYKAASDLKRIYSMDEATLSKISPFVQINGESTKSDLTKPYEKKVYTKKIASLDINAATSEQLDELPGIGPGYARMILNWRNKLGGFHSLEQIQATYNFPDSAFQKIKSFIRFDTEPIRIDINRCDEKSLAQHFYISSKQAKILIAYRTKHGPFKSKEELLNVGAMDKEWVEKVAPYLSF